MGEGRAVQDPGPQGRWHREWTGAQPGGAEVRGGIRGKQTMKNAFLLVGRVVEGRALVTLWGPERDPGARVHLSEVVPLA